MRGRFGGCWEIPLELLRGLWWGANGGGGGGYVGMCCGGSIPHPMACDRQWVQCSLHRTCDPAPAPAPHVQHFLIVYGLVDQLGCC